MFYKRIGYNLNAVACLVINPIMVDSFDALFNCTPVDRRQTMMARPKATHFSQFGTKLLSVARSTGAQLMFFFCFRFPTVLFDGLWISGPRETHIC